MTLRSTIVASFASALLLVVTLSPQPLAYSQEDRGEIAGTITFSDRPGVRFHNLIVVIPASAPQPIQATVNSGILHVTDDEGTFRIGDLPPGDYLVGFETNPDFVPQLTERIEVEFHLNEEAAHSHEEAPADGRGESVRFIFPATKVTVVGSGESEVANADVTIHMPPLMEVPARVELPLLPGGQGSISGRIYHQDCDACEDQFAALVIPADLGRDINLSRLSPDSAYRFLTDRKGRFEIVNLRAGDYLVAPVLPESILEGNEFDELRALDEAGKTVGLSARQVRVTDGESVTGIDFMIARPGMTQVTVEDESQSHATYIGSYIAASVTVLVIGIFSISFIRRIRSGPEA
jgi:hypothetical protein